MKEGLGLTLRMQQTKQVNVFLKSVKLNHGIVFILVWDTEVVWGVLLIKAMQSC